MRALPALWLGVAGALSVGPLLAQTSSAPPRPPAAERTGTAPVDRPPEAQRSSPSPGAAAGRPPASQTPPSLPSPPVPAARNAPVPAPGPAVPTENAEPLELLFIDATLALAQQQQTLLQADGLRLLRRQVLAGVGGVLSTYRAPDAQRMARWQTPPATGEANHRYRLLGTDDTALQSRELVGWPRARGACPASPRIGLIDTALDIAHPALIGARIDVVNLLPRGVAAAPADHGTAVASILVGQRDTPGLLPQARLLAVAVVRQRGTVSDTTAELLIRAVDRLVQSGVAVINLSLGGPANRWLGHVLQAARDRGMHLVAAAGNGGPQADPVFPASHPAVLAVTAVDLARRIDPRGQRGDHIAFAAPGVDVPVAQDGGAVAWRSGSSYAAPFVSAALALGHGTGALRQRAHDLGDPGRDDTFGWGLLQAAGPCDALPGAPR